VSDENTPAGGEGQSSGQVPEQTPPPAPPPQPAEQAPDMGGRPGPASDTSKILAAVGYIFWPVALVTILIDPYKDEKFTKFHGTQALGLWVAWAILGIGLSILAAIPFVGWILGILGFLAWIAAVVYAIVLAIQAFQGNYMEIPLIYGFIKGYVGE
jgi:uncharacterized membrane protein